MRLVMATANVDLHILRSSASALLGIGQFEDEWPLVDTDEHYNLEAKAIKPCEWARPNIFVIDEDVVRAHRGESDDFAIHQTQGHFLDSGTADSDLSENHELAILNAVGDADANPYSSVEQEIGQAYLEERG